jgi:hypothetical protein
MLVFTLAVVWAAGTVRFICRFKVIEATESAGAHIAKVWHALIVFMATKAVIMIEIVVVPWFMDANRTAVGIHITVFRQAHWVIAAAFSEFKQPRFRCPRAGDLVLAIELRTRDWTVLNVNTLGDVQQAVVESLIDRLFDCAVWELVITFGAVVMHYRADWRISSKRIRAACDCEQKW